MQITDLCGKKILRGVDIDIGTPHDSNGISIYLDDTVYTAYEDPCDGYRSVCSELIILDESSWTKPVFEESVMCHVHDDIMEIFCIENGKLLMRVGTNHSDSYYPSFVSEWYPQNMSINSSL